MFETILVWIHLLSFGSLFGSLLCLLWLSRISHADEPHRNVHPERLLNVLTGAVLATGFMLFFSKVAEAHEQMTPLTAHFWGSVGIKLVLLLAIGGLVGLSGKRPVATKKRYWVASLVFVALAAFVGAEL